MDVQMTFLTDEVKETDIFQWIVRDYEKEKQECPKWHKTHNFDDWLLYQFSHYCGGSVCDKAIEAKGVQFCDFMGSHLRAQGMRAGEHFEIRIPKAKVLKAFGIRDDHKDILKDCE